MTVMAVLPVARCHPPRQAAALLCLWIGTGNTVLVLTPSLCKRLRSVSVNVYTCVHTYQQPGTCTRTHTLTVPQYLISFTWLYTNAYIGHQHQTGTGFPCREARRVRDLNLRIRSCPAWQRIRRKNSKFRTEF